ncbi:YgaP-like transmembrane domain [Rhodospirillum centenum]|uniref:Inner membrane protein YgaP-like transmembrane domain-containing protein n=1 Tax=Rhodospirillum centenum (strain ATCC 51521 / SW) TaxID=414684 RepID=B6IS44_RHOCS|nr:YgaP-like transmembrane domain [Rhodospirillum centenum]ACI98280.1 hypothetical protein RC1_0850 [Rhodospirillum centenum SW]
MNRSQTFISNTLPFGPVNVGPAERMVTAGLGGTLLLAGLGRGGPGGTLAVLAGGLLLTRAVTGHCPAYRAMGITGTGQTGQSGQVPPMHRPQGRAGGGLAPDLPRAGRDNPAYPRTPDNGVAEVLRRPGGKARPTRTWLEEEDLVEQASEMSFPASDPPAYTAESSDGAPRR